jgi:hypothetical protein
VNWTRPAEKAVVEITQALMSREGEGALEFLRAAQASLKDAIEFLEEYVEGPSDD